MTYYTQLNMFTRLKFLHNPENEMWSNTVLTLLNIILTHTGFIQILGKLLFVRNWNINFHIKPHNYEYLDRIGPLLQCDCANDTWRVSRLHCACSLKVHRMFINILYHNKNKQDKIYFWFQFDCNTSESNCFWCRTIFWQNNYI